MTEVSYFEETSSYHTDVICDNKIESAELSLTAEENFKKKYSIFKNIFSRKNILKFGIMTGEEAIPIDSTHGNIVISTIDTAQLKERIKTFSENERSKIGYIHISTIQILIKSTFMKGINSPLEIALKDSRILDTDQATIAKGNCNLKYGKIKFDINLQIGLSLKDKDLDRSIVFHYKMKNKNFMKKGNHPFTIYYRINYALSNSHHSIEFKGKDIIHIDELFAPIVTLKSPIFKSLARNSCSLIEADRDLFEETEDKSLFRSKSLRITPPKRDFYISEQKELSKLHSSIEGLSLQVQNLDRKI
ncbi:uncharacterized protein LOC123922332 [Trifolium pratense]|uniref:uncharacterized protein LOC123922332 n=1 Tax=Trifolium pratense TaxID=57577 RepID=UPI001E6922C3|nr:uncharacterized protein LOC123922332 [Trifolium pratense]